MMIKDWKLLIELHHILQIILKSQQRFKNESNNVYTEEINKIALSSNDDETLKTFDGITSYLYGISVGKVCKTEILSKYK